VSIAVADVFRGLSNVRAIAAYVDEHKAPPASKPRQEVAELNLRAASAPASGEIRSVIDQQLELMRRQLDLLAGGGEVSLPPSLVVAPTTESKGVLGGWSPKANAQGGESSAYAQELIRRFAERTKASKAHTQKYRRFLADNRVSAGFRPHLKEMIYTIVFRKGKGSHFTDLDGNDYIDFTMGFGVNLFGHSPEFIDEKVRERLDDGYCVGPQSERAGIVAEKACQVLKQERIAFLNSGTEAVMTALRLARAVTGRRRVVLFEGSYHGHSDVVLARAAADGRSRPVAPGVPEGLVSDVVVLPYGEESALRYVREQGSALAAVLVEPVQSRYPDHQPAEFLRELRRITAEKGTALIFDEVVCGLRVAPAGAQEVFGIEPDLSTYGKVLGGGLPIGAVAGKARFLDPIDGGYWSFGDDSYPKAEMTFFAGTFCKHPLAMAAAEAVLDRFLKEGDGITNDLNGKTAALCGRLNEALQGSGIEACHFGSLFRFKSRGNLDLFFASLNLKGIYVWEGRNLFLSTAHTEKDLSELVRVVRETREELEREGVGKKR
jgi:glutamate-1-semialdehyde aminotransferase